MIARFTDEERIELSAAVEEYLHAIDGWDEPEEEKARARRVIAVAEERVRALAGEERPDAKRGHVEVMADAIRYVLDRTQRDPDLGYYLSPHTEAWERLVAAEAEVLGRKLDEHRAERMRDLQPEYRKREADVVRLRQRVEELEAALEHLAWMNPGAREAFDRAVAARREEASS